MLPHKSLTITFKNSSGGTGVPACVSEAIQVIEVGFRTFLNCCTPGIYDTELAEASIRRASSAGVFDLPVPLGFLDQLTDESVAEIVAASNELNLTHARAKKAMALRADRWARIQEPQTPANVAQPPPAVDQS
ncbi:MAG TPA: hypothetical protein VJ733_09990 [Candidatus Binatia bacterium]|nr:hypothetical protein [Candidatus Binatia bacterium]